MTEKLTEDQGKQLLSLAREAIGHRLGCVEQVVLDRIPGPGFLQGCGTFVTLKYGGDLRGCIGNLEGSGSIVESIQRNALSAAFNDHRFTPLTAAEFVNVDLEISILTPPEKLEYSNPDELLKLLRPGIDGVILQLNRARSTFLPQVWVQIPEPEQFLGHLSQKAGLSPTAWRSQSPEIFRYQVQSFKEKST